MAKLKLIIGNKKYSSWSMRPWLALRHHELDFDEELSPFDESTSHAHYWKFSPTKKVPVLIHGELTVWDSLAILEYLAELFPEANLWPAGRTDRARARSVSSEMHSGFLSLRSECPMNMSRTPAPIGLSENCRADVKRIEALMESCYRDSNGPLLFGEFTIADAMLAPVVNRVRVYQLTTHPAVVRFCDAIESLPAWQQWAREGIAEPWVFNQMEV